MSVSRISFSTSQKKEDWVEGMARFGYAALGVVYILIGALTGITALGWEGGKISDQKHIFSFILQQPAGKILLVLMIVGLAGYVVWQVVQAIKDPQNHDSESKKGYGRRAGYALSAGFYTTLAVYATKLLSGNGGEETNSQETAVAQALELPLGNWLVLLAAGIAIGFGLYQVYVGLSGKFMKYVEKSTPEPEVSKVIKITGRVGYAARGVVFSIVGFMAGKAGFTYNPKAAVGTENAFAFLQSGSFPFLMGIVAAGFICYGLFMLVRARYQNFRM